MDIRELSNRQDWLEVFPLVSQLRTELDRESYLDYLGIMSVGGYRMFAGEVGGEIVTLAGVGIQVNLYYGRHLWVYELVTHENHRSNGYGRQMLTFLETWARERDCELIALSSGLQRRESHRFYEEKANLEPASYVYKRRLDE